MALGQEALTRSGRPRSQNSSSRHAKPPFATRVARSVPVLDSSGGRYEQSVARKRFGRYSSTIVPQVRSPRPCSPFRPFSVQIVFGMNVSYSIDDNGLVELSKV